VKARSSDRSNSLTEASTRKKRSRMAPGAFLRGEQVIIPFHQQKLRPGWLLVLIPAIQDAACGDALEGFGAILARGSRLSTFRAD
jgi:hypothetical protein